MYNNNPENPLEWTLNGMACVASGGNYEESLEYYDIAIGPDPEFAFAYYEKGFSLFNLKCHYISKITWNLQYPVKKIAGILWRRPEKGGDVPVLIPPDLMSW